MSVLRHCFTLIASSLIVKVCACVVVYASLNGCTLELIAIFDQYLYRLPGFTLDREHALLFALEPQR